MNILAVDASGIAGSVAYIKDNVLVGEYFICHKLTHSETIMPMLENLKSIIGLDIESLDAIASTSGPGSFTGLRIGVTTAKAMALALDIPVVGVPTLDVLAHNITFFEGLICPIMDARRNQVYTAIYKAKQGSIERVSEYMAIDIVELITKLDMYKDNVVFLGDGTWQYQDTIKEMLRNKAQFAPSYLNLQRASTLAQIACIEYEKGNSVDASLFMPMYLRKPQAEREREEREKNDH